MTAKQVHALAEARRLLRPFWPIALIATGMGTLSGLATAWLLATINQALYTDGDLPSALIWTFAGLVALVLIGEIASDLGNSWIGQQIIANLRKELVRKIVSAPIDRIERYRTPRLIASLTSDVDAISAFTFRFSSVAIAFAVTIGCTGYLLFLSPQLFVVVAIGISAGIAVNKMVRDSGSKKFEIARSAQDDLHGYYRAITDGAKELRLNRERRQNLLDRQIGSTVDRIRDQKISAMRLFMSANALDGALFFAVVGLIIGWQGWFGIERTAVSGFVLVLLYVKGPLDQVVGAYGSFVEAQVSFRRIARLSAAFENSEPHLLDSSAGTAGLLAAHEFSSLDLRGVAYTFPQIDDTPSFVLGEIDLSIRKGEIVFIVGENGCGKSTLIKIILGLYAPRQGAVLLDGKPVNPENRDAYRQLFSAVFFDYFLFDDLIVPQGTSQATIQAYLERLEIAHKVSIRDGVFSTTDLSTGQRKRLAFIQVWLEARPVIVFDEWAAEQDPTFRRIFYTELLPDLKRQGKTLIVVSHDDRYFGAADRIVRLDDGQITGTAEEDIGNEITAEKNAFPSESHLASRASLPGDAVTSRR